MGVINDHSQLSMIGEKVTAINDKYALGLVYALNNETELKRVLQSHEHFAEFVVNTQTDHRTGVKTAWVGISDEGSGNFVIQNQLEHSTMKDVKLTRNAGEQYKFKLGSTDLETFENAGAYTGYALDKIGTLYFFDHKLNDSSGWDNVKRVWKESKPLMCMWIKNSILERHLTENAVMTEFEPGFVTDMVAFISSVQELINIVNIAQATATP